MKELTSLDSHGGTRSLYGYFIGFFVLVDQEKMWIENAYDSIGELPKDDRTGRIVIPDGRYEDKYNPDGYYNMLRNALNDGRYEASAIATTNYNKIIEEILGNEYPITYLNGSVAVWYDPYLNKIGGKRELDNSEHHIIVPLLFTQSGTKPMTSISMSVKYVDMYQKWKEADSIVVVGFGFGTDDEHINGILRTLVNDDEKGLMVVTLDRNRSDDEEALEIARKLKVADHRKIKMILVDCDGKKGGIPWTECLG